MIDAANGSVGGPDGENSSVSSAQPMELDPAAVQRDRAKVEEAEEEGSVLKKKDEVMPGAVPAQHALGGGAREPFASWLARPPH